MKKNLNYKEIQDKKRLTRIEGTVLLSYQEGLKGESGTLRALSESALLSPASAAIASTSSDLVIAYPKSG